MNETPLLALTQSAADKIAEICKAASLVLRICVRPAGCTALLYDLRLEMEEPPAEHVVCQSRGVRLAADPHSAPYLRNSVVEYIAEGAREGFRVHNPRAQAHWWCPAGNGGLIALRAPVKENVHA